MKAATDSKSEEKPRIVTYTSQAGIQSYKYEGVVIMITNEDYHKSSNPHIKAQLSRTHTFEMNLNLYDMYIKNLSIVENFINKEMKEAPEEVIFSFINFINKEIKEFYFNRVFEFCDLSFDIRFITKIADLYLAFGTDWKELSVEYKTLNAAYQYLKSKQLLGYERPTKFEDENTSVEEAKKLKWKLVDGTWYKPIKAK
jgi:hypothetical protein